MEGMKGDEREGGNSEKEGEGRERRREGRMEGTK